MTVLLPLLVTLTVPLGDTPRKRFDTCVALIKTDPARAEATAQAWSNGGGGWSARQCLGLAFVAEEKWAPAAVAFEQAATDADLLRDGRATDLWIQAGNAALADEDAGRGRIDLDHALGSPALDPKMRGETLLDRARADVTLNAPADARTDLDKALALVPDDPMAWLLSATLARREADGVRAAKDIAEALLLAPDDPAVAYEAGNVAQLRGDVAGAKAQWTRATQLAPDDPAAQSAAKALAGAG